MSNINPGTFAMENWTDRIGKQGPCKPENSFQNASLVTSKALSLLPVR